MEPIPPLDAPAMERRRLFRRQMSALDADPQTSATAVLRISDGNADDATTRLMKSDRASRGNRFDVSFTEKARMITGTSNQPATQ